MASAAAIISLLRAPRRRDLVWLSGGLVVGVNVGKNRDGDECDKNEQWPAECLPRIPRRFGKRRWPMRAVKDSPRHYTR